MTMVREDGVAMTGRIHLGVSDTNRRFRHARVKEGESHACFFFLVFDDATLFDLSPACSVLAGAIYAFGLEAIV